MYKLLTFARYPSPAGLSRARYTRVVFGRDDIDDILASLSSLPDLQEMPRLDLEQAAVDRGCRGSRLTDLPVSVRVLFRQRIVHRSRRRPQSKRRIVLAIFQRIDHGFCGQPMTNGIPPGKFFCLPRSQAWCWAVRCGGWPRFAERRLSCLRANHWLRFVILKPADRAEIASVDVGRPIDVGCETRRWCRRMRLRPQACGNDHGIDSLFLPPGALVAATM